jgi:ABC-type sugar transport system permease subunit
MNEPVQGSELATQRGPAGPVPLKGPAGSAPSKGKRAELTEQSLAMLLVAPAVLVVTAFAVYPIVSAAWLSLFRIQLQFPHMGRPFVGLANYAALLREARFWHAFGLTCGFAALTVSLELVLGLGLALLLHQKLVGRGLVRAAVLVPWSLTTVVAALMWRFMLNEQSGIVNHLLAAVGLIRSTDAISWLSQASWAVVAVVIADVWKTTPFMALLLLAGLQTIPAEIYEAGVIDGTSRWSAFVRLTLPLLRPTILVATLFRVMDAFRIFDLVFALTGGGPGGATETLSYLTYTKLFREFDFGMGSTLSVVTFATMVVLSWFFVRVLGARTDAGE